MREYSANLEYKGINEESQSQWRNTIRAISNPNGEIGIVGKLSCLNEFTIKDNYAIPEMKRAIEKVAGAKFITTIVLKDLYCHIKIEKENRFKTAFVF